MSPDSRTSPESWGADSRGSGRTAFTLVEILLAVAVLAVLAALVAPSAIRRLGDAQMQSSADEVCRLLSEARIMAMETGDPVEFRYEPGGYRFLVTLNKQSEDRTLKGTSMVSTSDSITAQANQLPSGITSQTMNVWTNTRAMSASLGKGISFITEQTTIMGEPFAEGLPSIQLQELSNAEELSGVGWSTPIVFRPDGTTSDQELVIADTIGRTIRVKIRGLTGSATMQPLRMETPAPTNTERFRRAP